MTSDSSRHDLRTLLRRDTELSHDALDEGMARFDLADVEGYRGFLAVQLLARRAIEHWVGRNAPPHLRPPAQSELIRHDLTALGFDDGAFSPAVPFETREPLGVAWALAGSSLGNRAMLAQLRKRTPRDWPTAFLSDPAMPAFWRALRPTIEQPVAPERADAAIASARMVFACFRDALDRVSAPEPA